MNGYRDMTFCPFYEDCADGHECPRALTPEVEEDAKTWWGEVAMNGSRDLGPPIAVYAFPPICFR